MPKIEQSITIQAPIAKVYQIARDVEAFPQFMADLRSLTLLERSDDNRRTVTEWVGYISAVKLPVKWVQEDNWDDTAYRDDFHLLRGDLDKMEGYWQFTSQTDTENEAGPCTRFDSIVDYEINIPMIGPMIKSLVKKLMTENLQATLNAIKMKAESD